ncbi:hypothetical protein KSS87_018905 [Heliosperma pusillum]|nr:hypothetical protein KSS87_018905 [Heliosperma pusillum]
MHQPSSPSPSLTLALYPHHYDLDFITPEPLNVYPPDNAAPPLPPPPSSPPLSPPSMLMLTGCDAVKSAVRRRSPRLVVEEAGVATGKCGRSLLVKLPDTVVSEKKACELARVCLGEADFSVRCLRSNGKVVIGSENRSRNRKRKRDDLEVSEGKVLRLENGGNVGSCEGRMAARRLDRPSMAENRSRSDGRMGRRNADRSLIEENVGRIKGSEGRMVEKRLDRSSMAENGRKLGLRHSPRLTKAENGSRSEGRMGGNVGRIKGKMGVRSLPRSSMPENGGKLGLRRSDRSLVGTNVGSVEGKKVVRSADEEENGGKLGLRCSPRLVKAENGGLNEGKKAKKLGGVENGGKIGGGRRLGSSSRLSMGENVGKNGVEEMFWDELIKCEPSLSKVENSRMSEGGKQLRSSPRLSMGGNVGRNGEKERFFMCGRSPPIVGNSRGSCRSSMAEGFNNVGEEMLRRCSSRSSPMVKNNGEESEIRSPSKSMDGNLEDIDEEKVLRRSPRALPSSLKLDDDVYDDDIKLLVKKKKKKMTKERIENSSNKIHVLSPIEKEKRRASSKCFFVGDPVAEEEAQLKWRWRYELKNRRIKSRSLSGNDKEEDEPVLNVKCHYVQAEINGKIFHLGDCALIRGDGRQKHIGRIIEFLRTTEDDDYFRVHWFYKPEDTVMKEETSFHDKKRIFYSTIENDNMLDCIISKLNVTQISPELKFDLSSLPPSDYYYDMEYCLDYSTFRNLPRDNCVMNYESPSVNCLDPVLSGTSPPVLENGSISETYNLLDVYAGCGAMSTGLCIGARHSGVNLVTRWAIDLDSSACKSLQLNHSETQVRNEAAEDFLELLKHWEKLCKKFVKEDTESQFPPAEVLPDLSENKTDAHSDSDEAPEELEVSSLVDICYGRADGSEKQELKFKVRWKGYGPDDDTWEPIEGLSNCQELVQDFVINGFKRKLLPLPGDVDVICGGPPCQGISGYNRFRCVDDPLSDERNRQLIVFMDIVDYLKPKFVLMENVTDILRFDKGSLGRYALSRLVHMRYQARVGIMAAGCYGVPQFRLRAFFWAALPSEELPQFPLPTHDVVVRYWPPAEFERNLVGYEEGCQPPELEDSVLLGDAISDLPVVTNFETLDERPYSRPPETEFQKYIRSNNSGYISKSEEPVLYDHRPFQLFEDDYIRVCKIPQRKGANFRDLPGVIVGNDNVVRRDPSFKTLLLPSGKPMVPEYAFTFEQGKSKRPFARLWWDETMPTIVTNPNCHCQAILHPEQDRVLTIRECARLQGFPDSFRLWGTVKQRYRQVGNAVAIPVAKALGYALGMASQKGIGKEEALLTLPPKFAYSN